MTMKSKADKILFGYRQELHNYIKAQDHIYDIKNEFSKEVFNAIYQFLSQQIILSKHKIDVYKKLFRSIDKHIAVDYKTKEVVN